MVPRLRSVTGLRCLQYYTAVKLFSCLPWIGVCPNCKGRQSMDRRRCIDDLLSSVSSSLAPSVLYLHIIIHYTSTHYTTELSLVHLQPTLLHLHDHQHSYNCWQSATITAEIKINPAALIFFIHIKQSDTGWFISLAYLSPGSHWYSSLLIHKHMTGNVLFMVCT